MSSATVACSTPSVNPRVNRSKVSMPSIKSSTGQRGPTLAEAQVLPLRRSGNLFGAIISSKQSHAVMRLRSGRCRVRSEAKHVQLSVALDKLTVQDRGEGSWVRPRAAARTYHLCFNCASYSANIFICSSRVRSWPTTRMMVWFRDKTCRLFVRRRTGQGIEQGIALVEFFLELCCLRCQSSKLRRRRA